MVLRNLNSDLCVRLLCVADEIPISVASHGLRKECLWKYHWVCCMMYLYLKLRDKKNST
jgi:hypothetical protein